MDTSIITTMNTPTNMNIGTGMVGTDTSMAL